MALGAGPAHAIYFAVYEKVKAAGEKNLTFVPDMAVHAGAGAAATVFHDGVMAPADGETGLQWSGDNPLVCSRQAEDADVLLSSQEGSHLCQDHLQERRHRGILQSLPHHAHHEPPLPDC